MPKNEAGEFELVLGNKQLLSIFFLMVVLLGVFFTMGYVVGRNSAAPAPDQAVTLPPPAAATGAPALSPGQAQVETRAQQGPSAPKPDSAKPEPAPERPAPPPAADSADANTFLQVVATAKTEADLIAATLRKKGFAVQVVPSPNPSLFRVLVGPFRDKAERARTREALVAAGFQNPIVRTYK